MPALDVLAYAKLNLSLDVLERRPDGYHEMRMVMQTVDLCDRLRLETGTGKPLSMRSNLGFLPADGRNLAAAAALRLAEDTGADWGGLSITLDKTIPVCAGLAGGHAGLLERGAAWQLTGLPADCALGPGTPVTAPGGYWLGTLAEAPAPEADGLTARAALTDTAALDSTVFFVKL